MSPFIMYSSQNPWNFLDMEVIMIKEDDKCLRDSAPVVSHLKECGADKAAVEARNLDRCLDTNKLLHLEALYISRRRPALNTREEYRQRYLTVKL